MIRRLLLAMVLVVLGVGFSTAAASAADELSLSRDGVTWSGSLDGPLFDPGFRWVPGDSETATFYVRNESPEAANLDVTLLTGPIETLIDTGDLRVGISLDGGAFASATAAGEYGLVDKAPVAPGGVRQVDVRVDFDPASTNESQERRLDLRFDVVLSQDSSVAPPTGPGDGDGGGVAGPGGDLPDTGTLITPYMFVLAVLLCAAGGGLVGYSRRRAHPLEERPSHAQA